MTKLGVCVCIGVLSGCGVFGHVPADSKGNTPLLVFNGVANQTCNFSLAPIGSTNPPENWLPYFGLPPGQWHDYDVKQGDYKLSLQGCAHDFWRGANIRISGPTVIAMYVHRMTAIDVPRGYRLLRIGVLGIVRDYAPPVYAPSGRDSGGGEDEQPAGEQPANESTPESSSSAATSEPASSSSSAPAAAAPRDCKPDGARVNNSHECCSDKLMLTPDRTAYVCCSTGGSCT